MNPSPKGNRNNAYCGYKKINNGDLKPVKADFFEGSERNPEYPPHCSCTKTGKFRFYFVGFAQQSASAMGI